ncbi:MAG: hypothetical protein UY92_C0014G0084 [Candidatus Magasanikbacteria bacterium GW2011_GWA2_56_11]|uniref:Cupin 2 conserved barrel domain-containing protein n=1 Tax=Candidatus Magasanikbacteria bacterium GW2011_GWA2_56_11 TaxID=1619044 RepID=A0A0G2B8J0_9BACT|nr:MAG: hypothetical protein UY92_C0014G0084 [Candidatus Magasanikbacteria bacterium GW2011_GWA2_56_11]
MFFVTAGRVYAVFEHVRTKERREMTLKPGTKVLHVPPWVSFATRNESDSDKAVVVYFSNLPLRSADSFEHVVLNGQASGE